MENNRNLSDLSFGELLKRLLSVSHQKSYVLAGYLNYDVSYISKWVTGNTLPAAKHATAMCSGIAKFLVENTRGSLLEDLCKAFEVETKEQLEYEIEEALLHAYQVSGEQKGKSKSVLISNENNSRTVVNPNLQKLYIKVNPAQSQEKPERMGLAMMMDLCALGKEDKMSIACADRGDNFFDYVKEIHYLLSLEGDVIDEKFDTLLLTYMLNSYADLNFMLSYYRHVPCSLMFAVQNYCMHMSVVAENHRAILSNTSMDQGVANETYDTIIAIERSFTKRLVSQKMLSDLIDNNDYLSFIVSSDICLYQAVMDEMLLPDDVFEEILVSLELSANEVEKLRSLHNTFSTTLELSNLRIALLEKGLQNYVISGEMDFYGHRVEMTVEQRERHLNHINNLMKNERDNVHIEFIDPQTLSDFDVEFAPCIYMSECVGYVRLRASENFGRVSVLESTRLKEVFNKFMEVTFSEENGTAELEINRMTRMLHMLKK